MDTLTDRDPPAVEESLFQSLDLRRADYRFQFNEFAQAAYDAAAAAVSGSLMGGTDPEDFAKLWNEQHDDCRLAPETDRDEWRDIARSLAAQILELLPDVAKEIIDADDIEARAFESPEKIVAIVPADFTVGMSRYRCNRLAVRIPRVDGFGGRAERLMRGLRAPWSHRERAYLPSEAQFRKFLAMLADGWDCSATTRAFIHPPAQA